MARRLCGTVDGLIPKKELDQLLERTHPPIEVSNDDFKNMVGGSKYRALLNYWYGVDVEEALVKALIDSISKERMAAGLASKRDVSDMAFHRAYGGTRAALLEEFAKGRGQAVGKELTETEAKEFTYWLFQVPVGEPRQGQGGERYEAGTPVPETAFAEETAGAYSSDQRSLGVGGIGVKRVLMP